MISERKIEQRDFLLLGLPRRRARVSLSLFADHTWNFEPLH